MAKDLELFDNKIIILYVLDTSKQALSINQIIKFCEEFDDITYFDICDYIQKLKSQNYIKEYYEDSNILYEITDTGILTLHELLEIIPGVNLRNLKRMINKNITKIKTDYEIDSCIYPIKSDEFKISCYIKDGNAELINITMYAGNKEQTKSIAKNWQENAEDIYAKLLEMFAKNK